MRTNDSTGQGPSESPTGHSITYSYDKLYRLTNAVYNGDISASYAYDYDPVGNMVAYTETIDSQVVSVTRSFNAINQITSETADGVGSKTISYDLNGNMTRIDPAAGSDEPIKIYEYDQRNLMIAACENVACDTNIGMKTTFFYDGNSDRLAQVQFEDGAVVENTTYANDIIGLTQVLVSEDASGAVYMLYGHLMIGQQIAGSSQFETHITDGLGSVRVEIETSGAINYIRTFSPFGETLSESGNSRSVYGYTGQQEDESTGLIYLRARYYSADLKAFTAYDVWPGRGSQPQTLNHYAYTTGNPINFLDPTGRCNGAFEILRNIERQACDNYDSANYIINHPDATPLQKAGSWVYKGAFIGSHVGVAVGSAIIGGTQALGLSTATTVSSIAGGSLTGSTYLASTDVEDQNLIDFSLSTTAGAIGGGMMATTSGIPTSLSWMFPRAQTISAAGTGMVFSAESYLISNLISGDTFNRIDFSTTTAIGTIEGGMSALAGPGRTILNGMLAGGLDPLISNYLNGNGFNGTEVIRGSLFGLTAASIFNTSRFFDPQWQYAQRLRSYGVFDSSNPAYRPHYAHFSLPLEPRYNLNLLWRTGFTDAAYGFGLDFIYERCRNAFLQGNTSIN